jgi:hypothetical protein
VIAGLLQQSLTTLKVASIQIKVSWALQLCNKMKRTGWTFDSFFLLLQRKSMFASFLK